MDQDSFDTIDWTAEDERANRVRLSRPQQLVGAIARFKMAGQSWLVLAISGALIGVLAVIITIATTWLADLREGHCHPSWYLNAATCCLGEEEGHCTAWREHPTSVAYLIYLVLSVLLAVLAAFMVTTLAPFAAGSGISEIKCIVSGFRADPFLSLRTLAAKCLGLPLTIASGLSVGKEGPSVHYAACVGNVVSERVAHNREFRKQSDLITACCGAGVAVAFGSPIGGVLFGLEEIASEVSLPTVWRSYFCSLVATSVVALLNPFRTGQLTLFSVQYDTPWHLFELPFFALLGVFGGLVGQLIIKYNLRVTALRKRYWGKFPIQEAFFLSLLTAAVCYFNSYLKVDMTKSMQILFQECEHSGQSDTSCDPSRKQSTMSTLAIACVIRLALLLISYGAAKVPAGIFVPSLAIGALFGRLLGTFVWSLYDRYPLAGYFSACAADTAAGGQCINPGTYALLGAGALLAGVMHITLTVVVVMFELTGALHYIVPTMIVVGITKLVSSLVGKGGIADMAIIANKLPFLENDEEPDYHGRVASFIMIPKSQCLVVDDTDTHRSPSARPIDFHHSYPVVDAEGSLVAAITYEGDIIRSLITVESGERLENVHQLFTRLGPRTVFVADKGRFLGLICRKDLIRFHQGTEPVPPFSDFEQRLANGVASFLGNSVPFVLKLVKRSGSRSAANANTADSTAAST